MNGSPDPRLDRLTAAPVGIASAKEECHFCGTGGCTFECTELLTFACGQKFVARMPHNGDMRTGYKLRTDGTPSANPIIFSYHKSYFKETFERQIGMVEVIMDRAIGCCSPSRREAEELARDIDAFLAQGIPTQRAETACPAPFMGSPVAEGDAP